MKFASALRRGLALSVMALLLFTTACDSPSPTATSESQKPNVESSLSKEAPADKPGATELPGEETSEPIPGQYIVVLKDGAVAAKSDAAVRSVATSLLGKSADLQYTYTTALQGFTAAGVSEKQADMLSSDSRVKFVEQDRTVHAYATQSGATWGLDRVDARSGTDGDYNYTATGAGVNAYIIDTGILPTHNDFSDASTFYDAFNDGQNGVDCNGHGTHVAGTVGGTEYGVAKDASLYGVRVLDCSGGGTLSSVTNGVDYVAQNHTKPAVANMSLGGGASSSIDNAVQGLINAGVTTVVAAGNSDTDACNQSPARLADAITVGSTTSSDSRSSFSNYGSCVDIFAPGSNITSAWYTSDSATNTISGTSMASPHVAGGAALYLENNPGASPSQVANALTSTATQGAISGVNGSPNLLLYSLLTGDGGDGGDGGDDGGDDGGSGDAPCTSCDIYSGTLSGSGDNDIQPDGTYYAGDGVENGYLRSSNGDFDLYLYKWNGYSWSQVASSTSTDSNEDIEYSGSSGYFYWEIYSYSGSGSYDFYLD
ncbi:peptidase S8 [Longibacter salinarum]|uniref:Peptidase S8 n=1 Tax=Longibacter salinarum TaxID=1850348 RepID=A0A2A8CV31_9BACT|nr:S8 family peptidase [Longibacter salinarum]PEN11401.1 peptidase S8 [Longibacter salinarum]